MTTDYSEALAPPADAAPAKGVSDDVAYLGIQVEKRLCEVLGRPWTAAGISIESLCLEISKRLTTPEPAKAAVTDDVVTYVRDKVLLAAIGPGWEEKMTETTWIFWTTEIREILEAALSATPPEAATKPAFDAYCERPNGETK